MRAVLLHDAEREQARALRACDRITELACTELFPVNGELWALGVGELCGGAHRPRRREPFTSD